ncbi:MAG: enolase [Thermoplasmata archaeon]
MSHISQATLRRVYDSRGRPTVQASIWTESGAYATVGAPSGASTSAHEAQAFPDGGVLEAVDRFRSLVVPRLIGMAIEDRTGIDQALHQVDGTTNFRRIGGNVATAVSVGTALALARERRLEFWEVVRRDGVDGRTFPAIVGNCINGGRHAIGGPDIQEFHAFSPDPDPARSIPAALAVHREVGEALHRKYPQLALGRGDEGGWVAPVGNIEALEILVEACHTVRDRLDIAVYPGLDFAASEFFENGHYRYREQTFDGEGQLGFVTSLVDRFDLKYVEDPFDEEAFDLFEEFTRNVGHRTLVVGDDIYASSTSLLDRGIAGKASNAVLIKVNQVGTLTDALRTVDRAREAGWMTVASHRSGDVPDGWLADLAVGCGSAGLKCGLLGGERVAKLNELLRLAAATGN